MKTMASPQKYSSGQTPSEGTARAVGVPEGEQLGIMSPEKQDAVGAEGRDFSHTPREKQVFVSVVAGQTNKDIAHELGVSTQTITHDVAHIFDKLAVSNRLELCFSRSIIG